MPGLHFDICSHLFRTEMNKYTVSLFSFFFLQGHVHDFLFRPVFVFILKSPTKIFCFHWFAFCIYRYCHIWNVFCLSTRWQKNSLLFISAADIKYVYLPLCVCVRVHVCMYMCMCVKKGMDHLLALCRINS